MDHSVSGLFRRDATRAAAKQALTDFLESWSRVVRQVEMPTREGLLSFFRNQLLANAVSWTAGVLAAGLVRRFFEVKGVRNLWGLAPSSRRTLVSAGAYELIMTAASFCAGLVMLILVRHLVLRLIAEFQALRLERSRIALQGDQKASEGNPSSAAPSR